MHHRSLLSVISLVIVMCAVRALPASGQPLQATYQASQAVISVNASTGNDGTCTRTSGVCKTIQKAIDLALAGDTISIAAGTYTSTNDAVARIAYKQELTIEGAGVASGQATIIDGGNARRGLLLLGNQTIRIRGVIVQNCRATQGLSGEPAAFGAGMLTLDSTVILENMIFRNNTVVGGSANPKGGPGSGGGLAILVAPAGTRLTNILFENNRAEGGTGETGGYGIGGGLYTYRSTVQARALTFTANTAAGGASSGSGTTNGMADAQGGAAAFQLGSSVTLNDITATSNLAIGGSAPNGTAGGAFGGGLFSEGVPASMPTSVTIEDAFISGNEARGNNGRNGGHAAGGGIQFDGTTTSLERALIIANQAQGGVGQSGAQGPAGGGGIYLQNLGSSAVQVSVINSVIADNLAKLNNGTTYTGGGGGGVWMQGLNVMLRHVTIARNRVATATGQPSGWMQGYGILVMNDGAQLPSAAAINYTIIANHDGAAVYVKAGNSATLNYTLWAANAQDYQAIGSLTNSNPISASSAGFVSPGSPNYDYHILSTSAARDKATGSTTTSDLDNDLRVDGKPDIGADEYVSPIRLAARARDGASIALNWTANLSLLPGFHHYELVYSYEPGASAPNEGSSPINVGTTSSYLLTGLTAFKKYTLTIEAYSATGLLERSNTVVAFPTDIFVFLPAVLRQ